MFFELNAYARAHTQMHTLVLQQTGPHMHALALHILTQTQQTYDKLLHSETHRICISSYASSTAAVSCSLFPLILSMKSSVASRRSISSLSFRCSVCIDASIATVCMCVCVYVCVCVCIHMPEFL